MLEVLTSLDCIPCFTRQALDAVRLAHVDKAAHNTNESEMTWLFKLGRNAINSRCARSSSAALFSQKDSPRHHPCTRSCGCRAIGFTHLAEETLCSRLKYR